MKSSGTRFEQKVARMTRGKRRPQSRDDTPIGGALAGDWVVEQKFGKQVPKFFWDAYGQAGRSRAIGDLRSCAVVVGGEGDPVLFIARLDDVVRWRKALVEEADVTVRAALRRAENALRELGEALYRD